MEQQGRYKIVFIVLGLLLAAAFIINISLGSVKIPITDILSSLFSPEKVKDTWVNIVVNYRIPKALTAILVGVGLSVSGLLMQTLFRNPLAGPFVLGVSSGASLGVAVLILGSGIIGAAALVSNTGISIAASLGALLVLGIIMVVAKTIQNTLSILIIGLMFGSFTAAIISVLAYFSSAEKLQQYVFWTFGSLGNLSYSEIGLIAGVSLLCYGFLAFLIKPLNSLLLGENYAVSLGVNLKRTRNGILVITGILTGVITAFSGPIAFIGLAVPHITRLFFNTTKHQIILPATVIIGAVVMLISDTIAQLPLSAFTLPINAVTTLFGAPIVIWLLVRKKTF